MKNLKDTFSELTPPKKSLMEEIFDWSNLLEKYAIAYEDSLFGLQGWLVVTLSKWLLPW